MTDNDGEDLITQSAAAEMRGMTLAAVNEHVRSGRWRSTVKYGKRLVYKADVLAFSPKTHKRKHLVIPTRKKRAEKSNRKKVVKK